MPLRTTDKSAAQSIEVKGDKPSSVGLALAIPTKHISPMLLLHQPGTVIHITSDWEAFLSFYQAYRT